MSGSTDHSELGARLVSGLEQFAALLDEENQALRSDDTEILVELARRKQNLAVAVAQVARAREALADTGDDPHAERISELAEVCEERNRANGAYIQGALSSVRKALATLAGSVDDELYRADGSTHSGLTTSRSLARG